MALVLLPGRGALTSPEDGRPDAERLQSANPAERAESACELSRRRAEAVPAIPALVALLGDDEQVGPVECGMSPWLRRRLEDRPEEWRRFATSPGREAAKALGRIGGAAVKPLLQTLQDANVRARAHAALALGEIRDRRAVKPLVAALQDGDPEVGRQAAWALGQIRDRGGVLGLLGALQHADPKLRKQSAWALGEIRARRAVRALLGGLSDPEAGVRRQVAWALGEIRDQQAANALAAALADPSAEVRRQAASALGELGPRPGELR